MWEEKSLNNFYVRYCVVIYIDFEVLFIFFLLKFLDRYDGEGEDCEFIVMVF